jgi:hypothetical protein
MAKPGRPAQLINPVNIQALFSEDEAAVLAEMAARKGQGISALVRGIVQANGAFSRRLLAKRQASRPIGINESEVMHGPC